MTPGDHRRPNGAVEDQEGPSATVVDHRSPVGTFPGEPTNALPTSRAGSWGVARGVGRRCSRRGGEGVRGEGVSGEGDRGGGRGICRGGAARSCPEERSGPFWSAGRRETTRC